jgi:monoamine oxidase
LRPSWIGLWKPDAIDSRQRWHRGGADFQPVGGMDQIQGVSTRHQASRITLNADVQSVHQRDTGVKVVRKHQQRKGDQRRLRRRLYAVVGPRR